MGLTAAIWEGKAPPDHLRVRVRVRSETGVEIVASREWPEIAAAVAPASAAVPAGGEMAERQQATTGKATTGKATPAVFRLDAPDAKSKPLKSLAGLDKFFTR